ncbi:hypothetical protein ACWEJ6_51035 [Nonomuraea sp. NPDC004702]
MYNTVAHPGVKWRIPDGLYTTETVRMAAHAIVSGDRHAASRRIEAVLHGPNALVLAGGLDVFRSTVCAYAQPLL